MNKLCTMLLCLMLMTGLAHAQASEHSRGQTTVNANLNTIVSDNNVKYVGYTEGELLTVVLNYSATCNVVFSGLTLRSPNPFTPDNDKTGGTLALVSGSPSPGLPGTVGSVAFNLTFSPLKDTGDGNGKKEPKKSFAMAHLNLVLGVDSDCDPATGDSDGVDEAVTIGVQVKVSTESHP